MKAIEKVAPGMSDEPALQKVVKATQESTDLDYITDKLAKILK